METLGMKSIWCSIPWIEGKPCGTSLGKTSSNSYKRETTELGKDASSLLVFKDASLYKSIIIGWFKNTALFISLSFA